MLPLPASAPAQEVLPLNSAPHCSPQPELLAPARLRPPPPAPSLQLLVLTGDWRVMGRRFRNRALTAAATWVIAAAIIAINASVAYQAAVTHLPAVGALLTLQALTPSSLLLSRLETVHGWVQCML